jgi:hypothetical protein
LVLAEAAAGATLLYLDAVFFDGEGGFAYGAEVDAAGAVFAVGAEAELLIPEGGAHVDAVAGGGEECAGGAGGHAGEVFAQNAGGDGGVDVGDAGAFAGGGVELDALDGTGADAVAAFAAGVAEIFFFYGAGGA